MQRNFNNVFPRILIIGETFSKDTGGGITLGNLFHGWPKEKLAVITKSKNNDYSYCENYYYLDKEAYKTKWLFNSIYNKAASSRGVSSISENSSKNNNTIIHYLKHVIKRTIGFISHFVGFHHHFNKIEINENLLNWINTFNPELVYVQPNSHALVRFVNNLYALKSIPTVVHFMDDYIGTKNKYGLFYFYYERKLRDDVTHLVRNSKILFSISQEMSNEFRKRFNRNFIAIHNPVDKNKWLPFVKNATNFTPPLKIAYTGRILISNLEAIKDLIKIVNKLNNDGMEIKFEIYSIDKPLSLRSYLNKFSGSIQKNFIAHEKIAEVLPTYDLLFLPFSFSKKSLKYTRLSMPTKVSEYLMSGVPILVYAPKETALYKYAASGKWGFLLGKNSEQDLINAIRNLYYDSELRQKLSNKSKEVALEFHEIEIVKNLFQNSIKFIKK